MNVKDLCLGAFTFGDAGGYNCKKLFETAFSHFYMAAYGSICSALTKLTKEKPVSYRSLPRHYKPDYALYLTKAGGYHAFPGALRDTTHHYQLKSVFWMPLYFARLLPENPPRCTHASYAAATRT